MIDELKEQLKGFKTIIENMDDSVEKIKIDQGAASDKMTEISNAYLSKVQESTVASYLKDIANSFPKDLKSPPGSPIKLPEGSKLEQVYQSDSSIKLKSSAELFSSRMEAIGTHLKEQNKFR